MMETDREQRNHRCRVCTKRFSSGRSLGGHMRSHAHSPHSNAEETEKLGGGRGPAGFSCLGYDLRQNPKKTSRLSDFADGNSDAFSKQCKDCGKGFPSWKALFGHMRCHSERTCHRSFEEEVGEEEGSWEEEMASMESFSDDNEPPRRRSLLKVPKKKRSSKRAFRAIAAAGTGSSSSITGYELEQEDVAISLMMLSRAIGECSDKTSWVLDKEEEEEEDSVNESRNRIPSSASLRKKRAMIGNSDDPFNGFNLLRSRFECITCKKSFPSYHALGGHRANHKRNRNCREGGESTCFNARASAEHLPVTVRKSQIHECAVCSKTFSSGQALGGHKRSHLTSNGGSETIDDHPTNKVRNPPAMVGLSEDVSEPLDLNLPAPADDVSSNLKAWWAQSSELNLQLI